MPNNTILSVKEGKVDVSGYPGGFIGAQALASGSRATANPTNSSPAFGWSYLSGRGGGTTTDIYRYFFAFDTSTYTSTITNPVLSLRGYGVYANDSPVVVRGKSGTYEAFDGGSRDIELQDYSRYSTLSAEQYWRSTQTFTSGWNDLALNDSASIHISESNTFIICVMDGASDYERRTPGSYGSDFTGFWGSGSAAYHPRLHFTSSATGWSAGSFNGVDHGDISRINGIEKIDIDELLQIK